MGSMSELHSLWILLKSHNMTLHIVQHARYMATKEWHALDVTKVTQIETEVGTGPRSAVRRFSEITGKDNLTVFSYSGRVKSPEWRRQRRRADLRQF